MPLYSTLCAKCKARNAIYRKVAERDSNLPLCCGQSVTRVVEAPYVVPDIATYESPASGKMITSRRERHEDLKRTGYMPWEPGIERDIANNRKHAEEKTHAMIDTLVDTTVRDLATSGRLSE